MILTNILKNIYRRKLRSLLTILGVAVGIFALTVMGAMSEKMNALMTGAVQYVTGQINVSPKGSGGMFGMGAGSMLSSDKIAEIEAVDGVESAVADINLLFDEEMDMMSFGMPPIIAGADLTKENGNKNFEDLKLTEGRWVEHGEDDKVVVGVDIAKREGVSKVGDIMVVRGRDFEVVGIIEQTLTGPDSTVMITLEAAREIYLDTQPTLTEMGIDTTKVITGISVFWKDGVDPDDLAGRIEADVADIEASAPNKTKEQIEQSMLVFNLIVMGSGMVALIVGTFSIMNTMIMAVTERTREIGIKKAIGASDGRILFEFVLETIVMSLVGGLLGLGFGSALTLSINASTSERGSVIFMITPRLAIGSIVFSMIIGVVAGLYPAWRASRLDPIKALRYG